MELGENDFFDQQRAEFQAADQERLNYETGDNTMAKLPTTVQKAIIGGGELSRGVQDLLDFVGTGGNPESIYKGNVENPLAPSHETLAQQNTLTNLSEGKGGMEDLNMGTDMMRYAGDIALLAPTGGGSLMGAGARGMMKGAEAIPAINRLAARQGIRNAEKQIAGKGLSRGTKDFGEDIVQGLEQGFLHGDYMTDKTDGGNIMTEFNPDEAIADVAFDTVIGAILHGAKIPGRARRKKRQIESDGYAKGQKIADGIFKKYGDNKEKAASILSSINEMDKDAGVGFADHYSDLADGTSTNTKAEPNKTDTAQPEATKSTSRKSTVDFKATEDAASTEDIIKTNRSSTDNTADLTLKNLEGYKKELDSVDTTSLNDTQKASHAKRLKDIEELTPKAEALETKLVKERIAKMNDKQLRAAKVKSDKAEATTRSNEIYNTELAKAFKERKPKSTVTMSDNAITKSNDFVGRKLEQRDEFYKQDNPRKAVREAMTTARKSDEYQTTIDEVIYEQNKAYADKNTGIKDHKDWKNLTLTERRKVVEDFKTGKELTVAQEVALSDLYNENTDRMYRNSGKRSTATKEAARKKAFEEPKKETKAEPKAEPKKEEPTFEFKKEDKPEGTPAIDFTSKDGVKYTFHKNTDGSLVVMKGGDKVGIATNINEAKSMANKHSEKTPQAQKKSSSSKEGKTAKKGSRFTRSMNAGLKGTGIKGEAATKAHIAKQTEGGKTPTAKVDPTAFKGDQKDALAFHKDGEIILRDWINGGNLLNHEILHSLLDASYDQNPKMKAQVDATMKEVMEGLDKTSLMPYAKADIKRAFKEDPQEALVTILSNPVYLDAFTKVESKRPATPTLLDQMVKLIKDIYDSVAKGSNNTLAHQMIDLMVMEAKDVADMKNFNTETRSASFVADSPLHKYEAGASKYVKGAAKKTWKVIEKLYEYKDKDSSLINYIQDVGSGSLIHKILSQWEVKGVHVLKSVQELADKMHQIDSFSRDKRGYTVQEIQNLLPSRDTTTGKQITVDEQQLADEIIGLDLQALPKAAMDRLIEADFSQAAINAELKSLNKQMQAIMNKGKIKPLSGFDKAMAFLTEQTLGKQKGTDIRGYAVNNTNQLVYNFTDIKGSNKELERVLDAYVTMKAMNKRKPTEIKKLDMDNLREIIAIQKHAVDLFKAEKSTGAQYRKGYLGGSMDPYWEYAYMDNESFNALENRDGWQRIAYGQKGYTHARRRAPYLKYEKGAIPTNQYKAKGGKVYNSTMDMLNDLDQQAQRKGESVKEFNRRIMLAGRKKHKGHYEPYYDRAGKVTGFRVVMSDAMKREHLGFQTNLSNAIANNIMDSQREIVYNKIVNQVNESMSTRISKDSTAKEVKDVTDNVDTKDSHLFLKGDSNEIKGKINEHLLSKYYNEVTPEIRAILPEALKDTAFINKRYQDELIGYRNEFLSDNRHLQLAEMWWRDMVIHFKESVIKKNPVAVMTNMMGNVIMLALEGAGPLTIAKEMKRAKNDIDSMYKGIKEVNRLELQLSKHKAGTKAHKSIQDKINAKQKELEASEAYIGITDGWYQSAIDDIYTAEHSSASPIAKVTEDTYRKMIEKTGVKSKQTSDQIVKAGCDVFMTRHSRSGRVAEKFISYSDYASRLAMYRLKRGQGLSKEASSKLSRDAFVDYRRQLPKELNALKVSGVVPFITWAFRMQPVLARRAIENPLKVSALMGTYWAMSDDMGYVGGAKVGNWIPQDAFMNPSIIGGIPKGMAQGDFPAEAIIPRWWMDFKEGDFDRVAGVNLR